MNYRHAYHAGNFADVLKHIVLVMAIEHLKLKPQPFRVIDTHAGIGRYDLAGTEAEKTGEWRGGIGRLQEATLSASVRELLRPYLDVVRPYLGDDPVAPREYPGSPLVARDMLRPGDILVANELHPEDRATLEALFRRDRQAKVLGLDGYTVLKSSLPPKERRGVVLVDPPFEEPGEFDRLLEGMRDAHRRFAGGTEILWFPIKDLAAVESFEHRITSAALAETLVVSLAIRPVSAREPGLAATGIVVVNPPFTMHDRLEMLLPEISRALAPGSAAARLSECADLAKSAGWRLAWLVSEKQVARTITYK